jgi:lysophospholipid acyltransferase (LPLAT)-like uncharacterized protein
MRARLLKFGLGAIMQSLRYSVENASGLEALVNSRKPFVLVFWHGSMSWPWWRFRNGNAAALVSMSDDGQILAELLKSWGYTVLRGSSSRGNKEAMQSMREIIGRGHVLCVTPDGPRGPYHEMKMGAVRVAQTMHVPLVMASVGFDRCKHMRSWDRFEVPWPFSRARVRYSDPITIDPELEGEPLEELRAKIEKLMIAEYRHVTLFEA